MPTSEGLIEDLQISFMGDPRFCSLFSEALVLDDSIYFEGMDQKDLTLAHDAYAIKADQWPILVNGKRMSPFGGYYMLVTAKLKVDDPSKLVVYDEYYRYDDGYRRMALLKKKHQGYLDVSQAQGRLKISLEDRGLFYDLHLWIRLPSNLLYVDASEDVRTDASYMQSVLKTPSPSHVLLGLKFEYDQQVLNNIVQMTGKHTYTYGYAWLPQKLPDACMALTWLDTVHDVSDDISIMFP